MSNYVLGIDAGATKSKLAIFTDEGNKIGLYSWGPLNHESLPGSFVQLEEELGQFIRQSLQEAGIGMEQLRYAVFGLAGVDTKGQYATISAILDRIGIPEYTLVNDGFLGVPAGSPTGYGISAINGTGESIFGLNREGRTFQIGGCGFLSSDMGGGGELSQCVFAAVYRELFRMGPKTLLTELLLRDLAVTDKHDLIETIYTKQEDPAFRIRDFNRLLFEGAAKGDAVATEAMREIAWNYAGGIACMAQELAFSKEERLPVIFAGSVFVKGEDPVLLNFVKERLMELLPGYQLEFVRFDKPPVAGAIVWALQHLGMRDCLELVCGQL